jgi:hypothetical protein
MSLETVDIPGVEILAADVTIHGRGSPPEGDRYSIDDLRSMAQANRELEFELRPPAKIGHDGNGPAVGRLNNIRVAGDKLVADVKDVPRRFAELVRAGAYTGRSVELSQVTSQKTGKFYPHAVSALAWLGGKLPAVQTLDDVVALYEGADVDLVRAYELQTPTDSELDEAIESGRISVGSIETWRRMFQAEPAAAAALLESRRPDMHTRLENRRLLATARPPDLDDALIELHERDLAARLGIRPEDVL